MTTLTATPMPWTLLGPLCALLTIFALALLAGSRKERQR